MRQPPERIVVTIDRLVLRGVTPGDAPALQAAFERTLGRVLAERGLPAAASLDLPAVAGVAPIPGRGAALGAAAAHALHGSIRGALARGGQR